MSFSVSHWSGRLGNNIQQVANCIIAAEKYNTDFNQTLDHDIISKFTVNFGSNNVNQSGRFYAWEALVSASPKGITNFEIISWSNVCSKTPPCFSADMMQFATC